MNWALFVIVELVVVKRVWGTFKNDARYSARVEGDLCSFPFQNQTLKSVTLCSEQNCSGVLIPHWTPHSSKSTAISAEACYNVISRQANGHLGDSFPSVQQSFTEWHDVKIQRMLTDPSFNAEKKEAQETVLTKACFKLVGVLAAQLQQT